ncbi:MAG: MerR family transcriptional regulator [Acidimicrobiia bacterium]|nr:MerR family transcriptional regulator [Acidimicrobiia bacterium]
MRLKKTYSSREVAAFTGLSARQLQTWHADGLMLPAIPPQRTAAGGYTERRYTPIELFELQVLADLRTCGFSVPQLRTIVDALRDRFQVRLFDATGGGEHVTLLTDGHDVYARTPNGELFNLLKDPTQPLLATGDRGRLREMGTSTRRRRRRRTARASRRIKD